MVSEPTFEVEVSSDQQPKGTLLVGLPNLGMAGVTAADYLVKYLDSDRIGHISAADFPAIAPFREGEPRHHTRLYTLDDPEISVLISELFVPVSAAYTFAEELVEWVSAQPVEELAVLHGVPFPHGPEEHTVFQVATPTYRERRLSDTDVQPLGGGFLDGVVGEIVTRGLEERSPPVGVYITPTHPPGPDIDASLLLLDTIQEIYGLTVDEKELQMLSEELKQYYQEVAQRMKALSEGEQSLAAQEYPEDRMFM